jgi:hypothetical protein
MSSSEVPPGAKQECVYLHRKNYAAFSRANRRNGDSGIASRFPDLTGKKNARDGNLPESCGKKNGLFTGFTCRKALVPRVREDSRRMSG